MTKVNKWTLALAAVGMVTLPSVIQAEEQLSPIQTALDSTVISGYANAQAQWDFGTGNYGAPRFSYNAGKQDGFSLNAVKLSIERPLNEAQWAAGYKVDLMFGPDADTFGTTWNSITSGFSGTTAPAPGIAGDPTPGGHTHDFAGTASGSDRDNFAVRQAYINLRTPLGNGLDFKVGVFDSIIGYESTDAGSNPNLTRSWAYTIEPFSHTGVLGSYKFNDMLSASVGVANTFGPIAGEKTWFYGEAESLKSYMGSLTFTAPESMGFLAGSTLYGAIINGFDGAFADNSTHYYVGGTLATPVEGFRLGAAYDYKDVHSSQGSVGYAWAVAGYMTYQLTEKLSLHGRGEYFASTGPIFTQDDLTVAEGGTGATDVPVGIASKVFSATGTIQYDLWKNVLTRLEFRWDHSADGSRPFGGENITDLARGFGKRNNYMLVANVIYKF